MKKVYITKVFRGKKEPTHAVGAFDDKTRQLSFPFMSKKGMMMTEIIELITVVDLGKNGYKVQGESLLSDGTKSIDTYFLHVFDK